MLWSRGRLAADETLIRNRVDHGGLLQQAIEEQTPMAGCPTVETEGELVEVVRQVRAIWPPLVGPEKPPLEERRHAMDSGQ